MPGPTKRAKQSQKAARKRRAVQPNKPEVQRDMRSGYHNEGEGQTSASDAENASDTGEISEPEDFLIGQPVMGWQAAEERLTSKASARSLRWYYKKKEGKKKADGEKAKSTYGNISWFFKPSMSHSAASTFTGSSNLEDPDASLLATSAVMEVINYIPPNFEEEFMSPQPILWQKKLHDFEVWMKRINLPVIGLSGLMVFMTYWLYSFGMEKHLGRIGFKRMKLSQNDSVKGLLLQKR